MDDDITKLDLYEIIGASITDTETEIKKAYRKKALSCHPDKNPDNPKATELFLQLTKALEILTDVAARAAYDKVVNAKAQAKERVKELDSRRKKFKDDLEAREKAFKKSYSGYYSDKTDEEKLKDEIERLKKEGSRLVEEEKERLRQKIFEDLIRQNSSNGYSEGECQVKIKWKVENVEDESNGGYDYEKLHRFLSKHGEISVLVLSTTKKGRALVEFKNRDAAESAVNYERGLITNPLKLEGVWEKTKVKQHIQTNCSTLFSGTSLFPSAAGSAGTKKSKISQGLSFSSAPDIFNTQSKSDADLESMVLNNLKRAEERKRIIEQMKEEDE